MIDTSVLSQWFAVYSFPTAFLGAFFFGESVIITLTFLAIQLQHPFFLIALAFFTGTVAADTAWFFLGRLGYSQIKKRNIWQKQRIESEKMLRHLTGTRPFWALLFIKFLYGSRIAMILYVAAQKTPLSTFLIFNSLGTIIWLAILLPLGVFAARGVGNTLPLLDLIQAGVIIFVLSIILFKVFSLWLTKRLEKQ